MANPEHLSILKQGVEAWNEWRSQFTNIKVDLSECNLSGMNLKGANLSEINLSKADLSEAKLSENS